MQRTILVVDDNDVNRLNIKLLLKDVYQVIEAGDCDAAEEMLASHRVDLVVLDLALPPEPDNPEIGMAYLKRLRKETPDIPVVVITGHDERALAKRARKMGALDFFAKPFDPDEVRETISRAIDELVRQVRKEQAERQLVGRVGRELLGDSESMHKLRRLIEQVAPTPSTVLIRGETGSGKELVARRLHELSGQSQGPFVVLNCAAMDADRLGMELFGYEKGAFPAASVRKLGWFERAAGGTLFLDEIASLPLDVQGKLLQVLENGEFRRIGGEAVLQSNARLVCSTQKGLESLVEDGKFRDDLYFRVNVVNIDVPPLRQHKEDIPLLVEHFLASKSQLCNKRMDGFSDAALAELSVYDWPGNVRELENVVERAVVLATGASIDQLPTPLTGPRMAQAEADPLVYVFSRLPAKGVHGDKMLAAFEKGLLLTALNHCGGVKIKAGRWLGFGDRAKDRMRYLCDKYDIQTGEDAS
ncbi:MAG: sigma-54 dependent transcriptional regulator [Mariprofundaceae bacterium]